MFYVLINRYETEITNDCLENWLHYTGCPIDKAERWILSTYAILLLVLHDDLYYVDRVTLNKSELDMVHNIVKFGWVILILWPFFENTVIFKFRWTFCDRLSG